MKLIVGLGNPGPQFTKTRHNVGFMVVDRLVRAHGAGEPVKARFNAATVEVTLSGERCLLLKPTTFMNLSGRAVGEAVRFFKLDLAAEMLVIVDDLYLPTGQIRMKPSGSAGGHNGLTSIEQLMARDDYPRLRIGVGQLPAGGKPPLMDQADYVLSRFSADEEPLLETSLTKATKAVEMYVAKGLTHAMNFANAGAPPPKSTTPPPTLPAKSLAPIFPLPDITLN